MSTSKRGFASMCPEHRSKIAGMGGRAAQARGTAHRWTSETAGDAGRKAQALRRARLASKAGLDR